MAVQACCMACDAVSSVLPLSKHSISKCEIKLFHDLDNKVYLVFLLWICSSNLIIRRQKRAIVRPTDDINDIGI